jgi:hypothetical protein
MKKVQVTVVREFTAGGVNRLLGDVFVAPGSDAAEWLKAGWVLVDELDDDEDADDYATDEDAEV